LSGLQTPTSWHWSSALHTTATTPAQLPAVHTSLFVHALPSSQIVPFAFAGLVHDPVATSHTPATWHWSSAEQTFGLPAEQLPAWHVSPVVQPLPSSQVDPLALFGSLHTPVAGLQRPTS
jgi:hypothetical protein